MLSQGGVSVAAYLANREALYPQTGSGCVSLSAGGKKPVLSSALQQQVLQALARR